MKIIDLLESGTLKNGYYQLSYQPTSQSRGLERIYNFIIPELAKTLDIPARNIKFTGWHPERGALVIKISNPKTEIDMIELMAPKALLSLLAKSGLEKGKITATTASISKQTPTGKQFPLVTIDFSAFAPQEWIDIDKKRYGR